MTWTAMTIPDDPADLPGWLESRLVGPDLGRLATELRAVHPPAPAPVTLDAVLGRTADAVLRSGLTGVPRAALQALLRNPDLLLELQERVLTEGGPYWSDLPIPDDFGRALDRGLDRLRREVAAEPAAARQPRRGPVRRILPYAITSLATAAAVLVGVATGLSGRLDAERAAAETARATLTRERDEARAAAAAPGWGWQRADAFPAAAPRADYLTQLADRAEEWFKTRPETPAALARRLGEFRQGCTALQFAAHAPLPEADRAWLRERCRVWSKRFDELVARVEETSDVTDTRAAAGACCRGRCWRWSSPAGSAPGRGSPAASHPSSRGTSRPRPRPRPCPTRPPHASPPAARET